MSCDITRVPSRPASPRTAFILCFPYLTCHAPLPAYASRPITSPPTHIYVQVLFSECTRDISDPLVLEAVCNDPYGALSVLAYSSLSYLQLPPTTAGGANASVVTQVLVGSGCSRAGGDVQGRGRGGVLLGGQTSAGGCMLGAGCRGHARRAVQGRGTGKLHL